MSREDIFNTDYWKGRLDLVAKHRAPLHHAIFRCQTERWEKIEAKHKEILATHVYSDTTILDAGCAWGRLLTLLPAWWHGGYLGIDLSPDFIALAESVHTTKRFQCLDLRNLDHIHGCFDIGVLISIRPMIKRNMGDEVWAGIESNLYKVCNRCLFLEYDECDPGSLESLPIPQPTT